ncbi:MAG TPA: HEPN domain-containing protein [Spirochaetota bacterium]|nr:HEPN domain-containing protein [Spirochaetota bacterium]HOT20758.1 HEPN domain-containing protein [Spirochaetota bacterium]HQG42659.1 HEPN domain-containing protein [Spirochaetota bacterium]HQK08309.1 HEPN domain-containing protein [Spirochaetota bacterium]
MNRWNDWFEQGKRDFERANIDIEYEYYEWACFSLQQASEKVLKALSMKSGLTIWGHSLTEILNILAGRINMPDDITSSAKLLDIYYIPTRLS